LIRTVVLSKQAEKDLSTVPKHVALKLQDWVEDVEDRGIEAVRKIPGYHDEPLKGALKGLRSIRRRSRQACLLRRATQCASSKS
jgi:proteic killer suppression protein